jgi:hypothetical protein
MIRNECERKHTTPFSLCSGDILKRQQRRVKMITEQLRKAIEVVAALPPEEQDRVAAAMRVFLQQPLVTSDTVRPEVMAAFEQVMANSSAVLDYLRDR